MRLKEITIKDDLKIFEYPRDIQLAKSIYDLYRECERLTHNFTQENYEAFDNYQLISDFRAELDYLNAKSIDVFDSNDQVMGVLRFLTDYFER
jgi:hypothetical protein